MPSAIFLALATSVAMSSDTYNFNGGGYSIGVVVGGGPKKAITAVHFSAPNSSQMLTIAAAQLRIRKFDKVSKRIQIEFISRPGDSMPPSFSLRVRGTKAVVNVQGNTVQGEFEWDA